MNRLVLGVAGMVLVSACAVSPAEEKAAPLDAYSASACMGAYVSLTETDSVSPFESPGIQQESEVEEACADESEVELTTAPDDE